MSTFNDILTSIIVEPLQSLEDMPIVSKQDENDILSRSMAELPDSDTCVHDTFKSQAASHPDALATYGWDGKFNYRQLDDLSDRLAEYLVQVGVGPGTFVPFLMEKSVLIPVVILGIMKAGGACVPLDSSQPAERMGGIIAEVGAEVLITSPEQRASVEDMVATLLVVDKTFLHGLSAPRTTVPRAPESSSVSPTDPVYVIFTSGTTGQPKGIIWEHKGLSTNIVAQGQATGMTSATRMLHFAAHVFDMSICELITPLLHGGCVCIPSQRAILDDLASQINYFQVNQACLTPTVAKLLDPKTVPFLQRLTLGGEFVDAEMVTKWAQHLHLDLCWGVSEAIGCNSWIVATRDMRGDNIGYPCGSRLWLTGVDDPNKLVPVGAVGEILIEGPTLARGYLNDQTRTKDAFVSDLVWSRRRPNTTQPNTARRFYRSGDLGKYNPDWTICIVGRKDSQVKIRGQRLELQEVENHISRNESVRHAVVCLPKSGPYHKQLVAIISLRLSQADPRPSRIPLKLCSEPLLGETKAKIAAIRQELASRLPPYAVPSVFVAVEDLPRSTSAKLNRVAIARYLEGMTAEMVEAVLQSSSDPGKEEPHTLLERTLQQLWSEILNVPTSRIHRASSFSRLGGDSITAIQLVAACRALGLTLSVQNIMNSIDLQGMARVCFAADTHSPRTPDPGSCEPFDAGLIDHFRHGLVPTGLNGSLDEIEDILPVSSAQKSALSQSFLRTRGNFNYFVLHNTKPIATSEVEHACRRLVERHSILRSTFAVHDQQVWQVVLRPGVIDFEDMSSLDHAPADSSDIIQEDMKKGFDLGSLASRFILLRRHLRQHCLILRLTHAVFDGASLSLIMKDFVMLFKNDLLAPVPSFHPFIRFKMRIMEESKRYWTNCLGGRQPTGLLRPTSEPYRHLITGHVERVVVRPTATADPDLAAIVKSAWAVTLARATGTADVVFGDVVNGRQAPVAEVESMSGICANVVPARVSFDSPQMTPQQIISQVHRLQTARIPHENLDLDIICEQCAQWRSGCQIASTVNFVRPRHAKALNQQGDWELKDSYAPPVSGSSLSISSQPLGADVKVEMGYCPKVWAEDLVAEIFDLFCTIIDDFLSPGNKMMDITRHPGDSLPCRIEPLLWQGEEVTGPVLEPKHPAKATIPPDSAAKNLVEGVWKMAFGEMTNEMENLDTACFERWRDPVAPAYLITIYRAKGVNLCVEDILDHPTMRGQIDLLQRKGITGVRLV